MYFILSSPIINSLNKYGAFSPINETILMNIIN